MKNLGCKSRRIVKFFLVASAAMQPGILAANGHSQRGDSQEFRQVMLEKHNQERKANNHKALKWSDELANDARGWAETLARKDRFEHAFREIRKKNQGENLWMGTAGYFSFGDMAQSWLDEKKLVKDGVFPDVAKSGNWAEVGHYTQIIWPQTRKLGCAMTTGGGNDFLVCRYSPAGNILGTRMKFR